jgi:hypothetical protein
MDFVFSFVVCNVSYTNKKGERDKNITNCVKNDQIENSYLKLFKK